jgi:lysophospholipase L1-like esterase
MSRLGFLKSKILVALLVGLPTLARAEREEPYVVGALGDSISAGFNALRFGDNREFSWTAGLDANGLVQSHARKIKTLLGDRNVVVVNEAFVGAESYQLPRQAARLLRQKPDYVTIAIGANDVCTWDEDYLPKLEHYQKHLTGVIETIIESNPKVKIVLAPMPSIPLMYELGARRPGCQSKWDTMRVCKPLLAAERTAEQRQAFVGRYRHLNQVIADIAGRYPVNVRLAAAIVNAEFDDSMISPLDCFHPSIKGQNLISELSFDATWY